MMIITHTRRPLWMRAARPIICFWLRIEIRLAERYAKDTQAGGVFSAAEVDAIRRNIGPLVASLAFWENA